MGRACACSIYSCNLTQEACSWFSSFHRKISRLSGRCSFASFVTWARRFATPTRALSAMNSGAVMTIWKRFDIGWRARPCRHDGESGGSTARRTETPLALTALPRKKSWSSAFSASRAKPKSSRTRDAQLWCDRPRVAGRLKFVLHTGLELLHLIRRDTHVKLATILVRRNPVPTLRLGLHIRLTGRDQ